MKKPLPPEGTIQRSMTANLVLVTAAGAKGGRWTWWWNHQGRTCWSRRLYKNEDQAKRAANVAGFGSWRVAGGRAIPFVTPPAPTPNDATFTLETKPHHRGMPYQHAEPGSAEDVSNKLRRGERTKGPWRKDCPACVEAGKPSVVETAVGTAVVCDTCDGFGWLPL